MPQSRFRSASRLLVIVLVNIVLLALLLEAAALAYYSLREGRFFYTETRPEPQRATEATEGRMAANVLHPVLGFIRPPGLRLASLLARQRLDLMVGPAVTPDWLSLKANNYGFFDQADYPYAPGAEDEYIIGLFGGSVTQWFALQGAQRLENGLRDLPALAGRSIRILSFGQGAFKQPQQLHTLAYFLALGQRLDFVVNIDGFNEVALAYLNAEYGVETALPSAQQMLPLVAALGKASLSGDYLAALVASRESRARLDRLDGMMRRNPSAAVQVALELLRKATASAYWDSAKRLEELAVGMDRTPLLHINPLSPARDRSDPGATLPDAADLWMRSSLLMAGLLKASGIPYLHVVQPNQYYSGKHFNAEEAGIAIDPDSPYREPAREGYPQLLARVPELRGADVHAESAVGIFDHLDALVYSDSCCHYNQFGNELLADFIAARMRPLIEAAE